MDQRLNFGPEARELKLGSTFTAGSNSRTSFHTLKYDFKPASVDLSKVATLDVSSNNQVTVTVPNIDSCGQPKTVFKGNQRNYAKECVIIIDKVTGTFTLERLHHNIQVKKTRTENNKPSPLSGNGTGGGVGGGVVGCSNVGGAGSATIGASSSSLAPVVASRLPLENSTQRTVSKTRVSTGQRKSNLGSIVQRHSPIQGSPSYPLHKSPQQAPAWHANNTQSTLPSIPLIGMDDDIIMPSQPDNTSYQQQQQQQHHHHSNYHQQQQHKQPTPPQPQQQQHHNAMSSNHPQRTTPNNYQQQQHQPLPQQHQQQQQQQRTSPLATATHMHNHNQPPHNQLASAKAADVGVLSSSDSSSDSDSSGSGSDSDDDDDAPMSHNGHHNSNKAVGPPHGGALPALLLDEDLRLSESNSSDSD